jgi:hypothetical protein
MGFRCQVVLRPFLSELGIYIVRDWLAFPQVHTLMDENSKFTNPEDENTYTERLERVFDSVSIFTTSLIFVFSEYLYYERVLLNEIFRLNGQRMLSKNTRKKCLRLLPLIDLKNCPSFSIIVALLKQFHHVMKQHNEREINQIIGVIHFLQ